MKSNNKTFTLNPVIRSLTAACAIGGMGLAMPAHATIVDVSASGLGQNLNVGGVRYEVIKNEVVNSPLNQLPGAGPNALGAPRGYGIDNVFYGSNQNDIFSAVGGIRVKSGSSTLDSFNQQTNTVNITSTAAGTSVNTVSPQNINGINTSVDYFMSATSPTLRVFGSFTNTTGNEIIVDVAYGSNLGSNANTVLQAASSGDAAFQANDRWLVSGDSTGTLPSLTFVRFGPNGQMAYATPGIPGVTSGPPYFTNSQLDYYADMWSLTLAPGATKNLMWFVQFNDTLNNALTGASAFANRDSLSAAGLLAGLTLDQQFKTANWALPEPGSLALFGIGALAAFVERRKRRV